MRRNILIIILIFVGLKYGLEYVSSEKFQEYGDRTKAPWTCKVNKFMAEFNVTLSKYERAIDLYQRIEKRCVKTPMEEDAVFQIAKCYEASGKYGKAIHMLKLYIERYPNGEYSDIAPRRLQILETSR